MGWSPKNVFAMIASSETICKRKRRTKAKRRLIPCGVELLIVCLFGTLPQPQGFHTSPAASKNLPAQTCTHSKNPYQKAVSRQSGSPNAHKTEARSHCFRAGQSAQPLRWAQHSTASAQVSTNEVIGKCKRMGLFLKHEEEQQ
jgi:hypothetical protein